MDRMPVHPAANDFAAMKPASIATAAAATPVAARSATLP
jgi:hypothetical protein